MLSSVNPIVHTFSVRKHLFHRTFMSHIKSFTAFSVFLLTKKKKTSHERQSHDSLKNLILSSEFIINIQYPAQS